MSRYNDIFNLVMKLGSTPELYRNDVSEKINTIIYNKLNINLTGCQMMYSELDEDTAIYAIFFYPETEQQNTIYLEKILTLDKPNSYILLIREDIFDLDDKEKTKYILTLYTKLLSIFVDKKDLMNRIPSIILTCITLKGMYNNPEEFIENIEGVVKYNDIDIKSMIDLMFDSFNFSLIFEYGVGCFDGNIIINQYINSYRLYKYIKKKE